MRVAIHFAHSFFLLLMWRKANKPCSWQNQETTAATCHPNCGDCPVSNANFCQRLLVRDSEDTRATELQCHHPRWCSGSKLELVLALQLQVPLDLSEHLWPFPLTQIVHLFLVHNPEHCRDKKMVILGTNCECWVK
jgi:hypothetical protein